MLKLKKLKRFIKPKITFLHKNLFFNSTRMNIYVNKALTFFGSISVKKRKYQYAKLPYLRYYRRLHKIDGFHEFELFFFDLREEKMLIILNINLCFNSFYLNILNIVC